MPGHVILDTVLLTQLLIAELLGDFWYHKGEKQDKLKGSFLLTWLHTHEQGHTFIREISKLQTVILTELWSTDLDCP